MEISEVYWLIDVYEKDGDKWIGRIETVDIDSDFIRRTWLLAEDDPGWGRPREVTTENVASVQEHALELLDLSTFDYFLCDEPIDNARENEQD